ncbi:ATP synthase membrane subunit K, mitochondrial isoform X1 [Peromyscus californicus insignis]|nr:ATP synthase membrane subunit K, mitochondrial isoform X1 [Peromyscus californicus insignis]
MGGRRCLPVGPSWLLGLLKDISCGICDFGEEVMAGPESDGQFQFTGIKKYFNSYTLTGRMNCVLATYGGIALLVLYFKLRPKKTPAVKAT